MSNTTTKQEAYAVKKGFHVTRTDEDGTVYMTKRKGSRSSYVQIDPEGRGVNGESDWKTEIDHRA